MTANQNLMDVLAMARMILAGPWDRNDAEGMARQILDLDRQMKAGEVPIRWQAEKETLVPVGGFRETELI